MNVKSRQSRFEGETADEVWQSAADLFGSSSGLPVQGSRAGVTQELLRANFRIEEPRARWVVSREPALNPAFALCEVFWIVAGREDAKPINFYNTHYSEYAGGGDSYYGAYGYRLRREFGRDQLSDAYHALRSNPESRQVVLSYWSVEKDLPDIVGRPRAEDIPCNICSLLKVRDDRLEWTQVMRSNDLFLGAPHNFVQFTTLQEIMSGWLDLEVGSYEHWSDSLHLYQDKWDNIDDRWEGELGVEKQNSLALSKFESDRVIARVNKLVDEVVDGNIEADRLVPTVERANVPPAYKDVLRVLLAEAARRRSQTEARCELIDQLTDPVLEILWGRWMKRVES